MGIVAFAKKHLTLTSSFARAKKQRLAANNERYQNNIAFEELTFIDEVNTKQCAIANINRGKRDVGAMSFFLVFLVCFVMSSIFFIKEQVETYNSFLGYIGMYEQNYYKYKELNKPLPEIEEKLEKFFGQDNASFGAFLKDYYLGEGFLFESNGGDYVIIFLILFLGAVTSMTGYIIFLRPLPVLVFDREKKYVYSYLKGKVSADRYEYIEYGHAPIMLAVRLYSINTENGELQEEMFLPYASAMSNLNFNTDKEANILVSFVNTFMREGRDAVMDCDYKQPKPLLLLSRNKLPKDFEAQIEAILIKRDKEKALNAQHS
ncbi:MAG: hypothetical protein ACQEWL_16215 [Pseudomonadota bacterium]|uniref:hypothetical protein n=1 Tax=Providencia manganoxydans TaxID=2923283 RepID=UPI003AF3DCF2